MAADSSNTSEEKEKDCIFCLIANGHDEEAKVMMKNREMVCFKDIHPAAPHHYLVVPIEHIHSCHSLHRGHIGLVKRMREMGKSVLRDQGINNMKDIRLGFHQPPYTSVDHLHLHVLAPVCQISEYLEYKFIPQTLRFITEECMLKKLKAETSPVNRIENSMLLL